MSLDAAQSLETSANDIASQQFVTSKGRDIISDQVVNEEQEEVDG